jgi:hypothetical protein
VPAIERIVPPSFAAARPAKGRKSALPGAKNHRAGHFDAAGAAVPGMAGTARLDRADILSGSGGGGKPLGCAIVVAACQARRRMPDEMAGPAARPDRPDRRPRHGAAWHAFPGPARGVRRPRRDPAGADAPANLTGAPARNHPPRPGAK